MLSKEGTTQGDPVGMAIYAIGITPLVDSLVYLIGTDHNKTVAFADDFTASGNLESIRKWWDNLTRIGPSFGYFPQPVIG